MKLQLIVLFLLSLASSVRAQSPLQTLLEVEYINSHYNLGTGMIGLGDINHDGKPDFAVSAGKVAKTFIYYGGKEALDDTVDLVIQGGGILAKGDLNGDGIMDLAVATHKDTVWVDYVGVYFGKKNTTVALDTVPDIFIRQEQFGDFFGQTFAIGDLNYDGYDDLVVGAPSNGRSEGKVYVYYGGSEFKGIANETVRGDSVNSQLGSNITIADINGDGIKDLAIGSDRQTSDAQHVHSTADGLLDIYYGKSGWHFTKDGYDQRFDRINSGGLFPNIYNLVDVNVDGKADISMYQGDSAYFFYGRTDSVRHTADFILFNPDTSFYRGFASPACPIGDINNDGKSDYAIRMDGGGISACMEIYLGSSTPQTRSVADRCKGAVNGGYRIIVPLGDLNEDGVNDFGTVAPYGLFDLSDGYFIVFKGSKNYVTSVKPHSEEAPKEFTLEQNYPNPFNPSTTISFSLPRAAHAALKVFNALGEEVATLVSKELPAGTYQRMWEATGMASGTYFYRLQSGTFSETKKLMLVR